MNVELSIHNIIEKEKTMKKMLVIALAAIMLLSIALAAFGDQYTDLIYTIDANYYEISVPSSLTLYGGSNELNISMTENHTGSAVNVLIEGTYSTPTFGWRLQSDPNYLAAEIIDFNIYNGETPIAPGSTISIGPAGVKLNVWIDDSTLKFAPSANYTERLKFKIS